MRRHPFIATGSMDNTIRIWDLNTGQYRQTCQGIPSPLSRCQGDLKTRPSGALTRVHRTHWAQATKTEW